MRRSCAAKGFFWSFFWHKSIIDDGFASITLINCKLKFSPNCHNIFILTMPAALGRSSGAVYGEKLPKTHLACIYCYGNTLYVVNLVDVIAPGVNPWRTLLFLFFFYNLLKGALSLIFGISFSQNIYLCCRKS